MFVNIGIGSAHYGHYQSENFGSTEFGAVEFAIELISLRIKITRAQWHAMVTCFHPPE